MLVIGCSASRSTDSMQRQGRNMKVATPVFDF